jgi:secondary thiamine-phosphate synthase enzyme
VLNEIKILSLKSKGDCQIHDISGQCHDFLEKIKAQKGALTVSVKGSTASITTIEYEPGLIQDLPAILDKLIPEGSYEHDQTWHDGNGHAHLRSTLIGTTKTFPVLEGVLCVGTWQQIVLIDFDNKPRSREIYLHFLGE